MKLTHLIYFLRPTKNAIWNQKFWKLKMELALSFSNTKTFWHQYEISDFALVSYCGYRNSTRTDIHRKKQWFKMIFLIFNYFLELYAEKKYLIPYLGSTSMQISLILDVSSNHGPNGLSNALNLLYFQKIINKNKKSNTYHFVLFADSPFLFFAPCLICSLEYE